MGSPPGRKHAGFILQRYLNGIDDANMSKAYIKYLIFDSDSEYKEEIDLIYKIDNN